MSQTKHQSNLIDTNLRAAIAISAQIRELRKSEAEALRFVPEGAHMVGDALYEVKRIKMSGENHPNQTVPKYTKVVRRTTRARAERIGVASVST
jgi:hypothetical protein